MTSLIGSMILWLTSIMSGAILTNDD